MLCKLDHKEVATASVLGFSEEPASKGPYLLAPATKTWPGALVVSQLAAMVTSELENMEKIHLQVLLAASQARDAEDQMDDIWQKGFAQLENFVFLALCDGNCCELAASTMRAMMHSAPSAEDGDAMLRSKGLVGVMKLMYPADGSGDAECQGCVEALLRELAAEGQARQSAVVDMLSALREESPESIQGSLRQLVENVELMS